MTRSNGLRISIPLSSHVADVDRLLVGCLLPREDNGTTRVGSVAASAYRSPDARGGASNDAAFPESNSRGALCAGRREGLTLRTLKQGGLPLVLSQTFRTVIRSRMQAGLDKYGRQYPHADVLLFEPAREDADIFFANVFGYAQRARVCALAYEATRADLRARAAALEPRLRRHGLALNARLHDPARSVTDALCDARPLRFGDGPRGVRQAARDLARALDHLERQLAALRSPRSRAAPS